MKKNLLIFFSILLQISICAQTPAAVSIPLTVTDNVETGSIKIFLKFGLDPSATDGLDASLGESSLPPLPPLGAVDARFLLSDGESSLEDYRQGSASFVGEKTYILQLQPRRGSTLTLEWNLPKGVTGKIQDRMTGNLINVPVSDSGSYTIADPESFPKLNFKINYALAQLPAPQLLSPENNSINQPLSGHLSWKSTPGANGYRLQIAKDETFNSIILDNPALASLSQEITGLEGNTSYFWRVRASAGGISGEWSEVWSFTTEAVSSVKYINSGTGEYCLLQNYPNPFNPSTLIRFTLKDPGHVILRVFNQLGEMVSEIINEELNVGTYEKLWNAINCPSGFYYYELRSEGFRSVKKMLLLR